MMPIRAALRALLVAVLAALTVATPAPQAQALVHVYTYDGCHPTASSTYAITERGPPAENVNLNAYDADGLRPLGAVECPEGIGGPTSYDYDDTQWSVRIERGSWTVEWPIGSARAKHAVHARWCVAAKAAPETNKIYWSRALRRMADEAGPYHNFPGSFDETIFSQGTRTVNPSYFNKARPNLGNDSIQYRLPGELNGRWGVYEIFARPSVSGRTEMIMHRFFRPDH